MPSGCKSNTQNKKMKDLKGNPSRRGLSFCLFLFVLGFSFVLFCFVFHCWPCGGLVAACMPSPGSVLHGFRHGFFPSCLRRITVLSTWKWWNHPLWCRLPLVVVCCRGTCVVSSWRCYCHSCHYNCLLRHTPLNSKSRDLIWPETHCRRYDFGS